MKSVTSGTPNKAKTNLIVNVVFKSAVKAKGALIALTSESVFYEGTEVAETQLRDAKSHPDKRGVNLKIRVALDTDKKVKNARSKSKYYLWHGEPSFEDERYRVHDPNMDMTEEERNVAREYRFREVPADGGDELFPEKVGGVRERSPIRRSKNFADLFENKLERPRIGLAGGRSTDLRDRTSGSKSRDRSKSPDSNRSSRSGTRRVLDEDDLLAKKPTDLRSRLGSKPSDDRWVKGDKLAERLKEPHRGRERRGRRKAADLF